MAKATIELRRLSGAAAAVEVADFNEVAVGSDGLQPDALHPPLPYVTHLFIQLHMYG